MFPALESHAWHTTTVGACAERGSPRSGRLCSPGPGRSSLAHPTSQLAVESVHSIRRVQQRPPPAYQFADLAAKPQDLLPRWSPAQVDAARARRVASANGVAQEVERFVRNTEHMRPCLVDRQLQLLHHGPHRGHRPVGVAATADHEIGDPCGLPRFKSLLRVVRCFRPRSSVSSTGAISQPAAHAILLDVRERLAVHSRRSAVGRTASAHSKTSRRYTLSYSR
jgi:hypothetical protein